MPRETEASKTIERTLDSRIEAVYYLENQWVAFVFYDGPTLNLHPKSARRLRNYLNDPKPAKSAMISDLYTGELDDGWLTLVLPVHHYGFSELATARLKAFLNEVIASEEKPTDEMARWKCSPALE